MKKLKFLKSLKNSKLLFENHPATELDLEQKLLYIKALSLLLDENVLGDDPNLKTIMQLTNNLGLNNFLIEDLMDFANNPDEDIVNEIIEFLKSSDIRFTLLSDYYYIFNKNNSLDSNKEEALDTILELLNILINEKEFIKKIVDASITKNTQIIESELNGNPVFNKNSIRHIIAVNNLANSESTLIKVENHVVSDNDIAKFYAEAQNEIDKMYDLCTGELIYDGWGKKSVFTNVHCSNVLEEYVNNFQLALFLSFLYSNNKIQVKDNIVYFEEDPLVDLKFAGIEFIKNTFYSETKIIAAGLSPILPDLFIDWLYEEKQYVYEMVYIDGQSRDGKVFVMNKDLKLRTGEFYLNRKSNSIVRLTNDFSRSSNFTELSFEAIEKNLIYSDGKFRICRD